MSTFSLIQQIKLDIKNGKFKSKKDITANDFADYPWDQCVADQTKAYGSKEIAEKVCGKIKAENSSKQFKDMENPCEAGYIAYGTKDLDGREVPNCVPIKK